MRSARFHIAPVYFLNGAFGTLAYWGISKYIVSKGGLLLRELQYIGENSIVYLCIHQLLIMGMQCLFKSWVEISIIMKIGVNSITFITVMAICRVAAALFRKYKLSKMIFGIT